MPSVADIIAQKGSHIFSIYPTATVFEAVRQMNHHKVGALCVMENGVIVGIFTERDVLRRVLAELRDPATTPVCDVMSTQVIFCTPETDIEDASEIMRQRRIRHLPVCDQDGKMLGLISIGDLNAQYASCQQQTIHYLTDYIYGRN